MLSALGACLGILAWVEQHQTGDAAMSTTYSDNRVGTDGRIDAARLQLFQEILGCVSGTAQTPEITNQLVRPK